MQERYNWIDVLPQVDWENLPDVPMQSWIALAREPETPSTPGKACSL